MGPYNKASVILDTSERATMELISVLRILVVALLLHMIYALYASWHYSRKGRSLCCLSLPLLPCIDPMGFTDLLQSLAADRVKLLPELLERRFWTMGELQMDTSLARPIRKTYNRYSLHIFRTSSLVVFDGIVLCPLLGNGIYFFGAIDTYQYFISRRMESNGRTHALYYGFNLRTIRSASST
ncbi:hypothetical protein N7481_003306 [Penicillium waksmanii]|uniref:uncharacterized protein n=1 Tax=Penicillium waksmanii TaxID=69791 RepID=UPI0025483B66|nr:uncharacterized protein N7481_003306 [Penicillium waksmanii]KAJ5988096.1 hypothetical protein N7481_003306 [Penicillium waksmanii]